MRKRKNIAGDQPLNFLDQVLADSPL